MTPPEEIKREFVEQWLQKADEDLGVARHLLETDAAFYGAVAFHSQQCAEKYLKALLVSRQIPFPKTHDIAALLDLVATTDKGIADSLREAIVLSRYAVQERYPGNIPDLGIAEARAAFKTAENLRNRILPTLQTPG